MWQITPPPLLLTMQNSQADKLKLMDEVSQLSVNIEELEQYGRQTSFRFHNVPMAQETSKN